MGDKPLRPAAAERILQIATATARLVPITMKVMYQGISGMMVFLPSIDVDTAFAPKKTAS